MCPPSFVALLCVLLYPAPGGSDLGTITAMPGSKGPSYAGLFCCAKQERGKETVCAAVLYGSVYACVAVAYLSLLVLLFFPSSSLVFLLSGTVGPEARTEGTAVSSTRWLMEESGWRQSGGGEGGEGEGGGGRGRLTTTCILSSYQQLRRTDRHGHVATEFPLKFIKFNQDKVVKYCR